MTWTAPNGTTPFGAAHNVTSFTGTTLAVGDLILLVNTCHSTSPANEVPTTPTNANGRISWVKLGSDTAGLGNTAIPSGEPPQSWSGNVWAGTVLSVGSETVTLNYSGSAPSFTNAVATSFRSSVGSWVLAASAVFNNAAGTSAWPSFAQAGGLYYGYAWDSSSALAPSPNPDSNGFHYNANADGTNNGSCYNLSNPASTSPVWSDSTENYGLMVLMAEAVPGPGGRPVIPRRSGARAVTRGYAAPFPGGPWAGPVLRTARTEVISRVTGRVISR